MPLDHYVSQVHLRKFYSPELGERMYAVRKSDLKSFTPNARAVCGINEGSTNAYLREDRVVEEFLATIEPEYNAALERLATGQIDSTCIYTVAGFVAYVITCSPGGMRVNTGRLEDLVKVSATKMDDMGMFPKPPAELGGENLTDLLNSGVVEIDVDPKYYQAHGISSIMQNTASFGNFEWEILRNPFGDNPLFTSDYPVAIESADDPRVFNRLIPLAPNLAIRIKPDINIDRRKADFSFKYFRFHVRDLNHNELLYLNRQIVRCAEEIVFYRDDRPWVIPFIAKNRHYSIEPITLSIDTPTGTILIATQRVVEKREFQLR